MSTIADQFLALTSTGVGLLQCLTVGALIMYVFNEFALRCLSPWVSKKEWWPQALPLQKTQMVALNYPEAECTEDACRNYFCGSVTMGINHVLAGSLALPVVLYGWAGAGAHVQALFVLGVLLDVSYDVYDWLRLFLTTFLYDACGSKIFFCGKSPVVLFIMLGVLHHPLALTLACPTLLHYLSMRWFHEVVCSMLLAAGICMLTGQYKLTLNMTKAMDWYQFKFIVVVQMVAIVYSRGYLWFTNVYSGLRTVWADGAMGFVCGGLAMGLLMSLFNIMIILDALAAAAKWLPKGRPEDGSDEHHELNDDLALMVPPTPSKGNLKSSLKLTAAIGLTPAQTFRASVRVAVAAGKFKKGLQHKHE